MPVGSVSAVLTTVRIEAASVLPRRPVVQLITETDPAVLRLKEISRNLGRFREIDSGKCARIRAARCKKSNTHQKRKEYRSYCALQASASTSGNGNVGAASRRNMTSASDRGAADHEVWTIGMN